MENSHRPIPTRTSFMRDNESVRRREPVAIRELLKDVLRKLRPTTGKDPVRRLTELGELWRKVVGEDLAQLSRVAAYRGGIMTVAVQSSPLCTELGFGREQLIDGLRSHGLDGLHGLEFKVDEAGR